MKHCHKSHEPDGLKIYRSENPEASWEQFKNEAQSAYNELKSLMYSDQRGLCAYCEINLDSDLDQMVEHFHPKNDTSDSKTNWHLEWTNLLLCCKGGTAPDSEKMRREGRVALEPSDLNRHCDTELKGDNILDGLIFNPLEIAKSPCIWRFLSIDGSLEVDKQACKEVGIEPDVAAETISVFNLNSPTLRANRQTWYNQIMKKLTEGRERRQTKEYLIYRYIKTQEEGTKPRFFTTARLALGKIAEDFLAESDDF